MTAIPTLHTQRLVLRAFTLDDAADLARLAGAWEIADTTLHVPHPYTLQDAHEFIASHAQAFEEGRSATWAITDRSSEALIGAMGLTGISAGHQAELGYWVGKPYWNRGYCTEAGQAVLRFAFEQLGLVRVHACHLARNPASGRVMQKLGMKHEGTRSKHLMKWGQLEDQELYGILK